MKKILIILLVLLIASTGVMAENEVDNTSENNASEVVTGDEENLNDTTIIVDETTNENETISAEEENSDVEASDLQDASTINEVTLGNFNTQIIYNGDYTAATVIITYDGECEELTLTNQEIIQPLIEKGIYAVNYDLGDWANTIAFDVYANGLISLDINVWGENFDEPLGTKRVETTITDLKSKVEIKEVEVPVTYDITSNVEGSSSQASMNVTYTNVNSYNWTIPTDFNLNDGSKLTVSVTDPQISDEAALKIKINSVNNYKLVGANPENSNAMSYTITNENGVALNNESNNVALQYNMDTDIGTKSANLTFNYNSNEALYTDTYSDQLNFTAQIGLGSGTKINIGSKKYILLDQVADNQYLVMERDSIGNIPYNIDGYNGQDSSNGVYSNQYEGSYIDTYLNNDYYNSLPTAIQNAIVETTIKQNFYLQSGSNLLYSSWGYKPGTSEGEETHWYNEGTVENSNWVPYYNHIPQDGEEGRLPLRVWALQSNRYDGLTSNEISCKVFLPSVEEVSKVVDLNSQKEVAEFVKNSNGANSHLWLRDSRSVNVTTALSLNFSIRSLDYFDVTHTGIGVRPAYVLDLSKVSYTIEGKINFTINGITYKAKEGSTWEEWVNSKYNTLGYTIDSNGNISKNNMYVTNTNDINDKVSKSDVITADTAYYGSEFILTSGTKLTIGTKKYIVIEQKGTDQYLLMERDSAGYMAYNIDEYNGQDSSNDIYSNLYENSYVDTYLNNDYYNDLPYSIQNAIVETTIKQKFYSQNGSNSKWYYGTKTDTNGSYNGWWYNEGTEESPNWVIYNKHIPITGNEGASPLNFWTEQSKRYDGTVSNEISRKVFLPSVNEVSKIVNLSDELEIYNFLEVTNGNINIMWLRDSYSGSTKIALDIDHRCRSLDSNGVTNKNIGVLPAYVLNLSGLDYIIE